LLLLRDNVAAAPQHSAVSLWLTVEGSIVFHFPEATPQEIRRHSLLSSGQQNGKAKPHRTVLRQSRHTANCLVPYTARFLLLRAYCLLRSVLFVVRAN
jgi:hypothetical protein